MLESTLRAVVRVEDLSQVAGALGYAPLWCELPADRLGRSGGRAAIVGRQGGFEWYGFDTDDPVGAARAARALADRGIPGAVLGLDSWGRRLFVAAGAIPPLTLLLDGPDPLGLARLVRCAAQPEPALATVFRISEALAAGGLDERFFTAFQRTLTAIVAALPERIAVADRHALALLHLTRLLFVYFIEAKGWLGSDRRVLREAVDQCLLQRRSLHRDVLDPLFFGTLNQPYQVRSRLARRFGPVPFLNGGLFEPHPLERRWRVTVPTPVLRDAFDSLLERFHFTLGRPSGEAIAPDMLGRLFEGVMEPGERRATGSYYTPAALVEGVMQEALAGWLERRLGIPLAEAEQRLRDPDCLTRNALGEIRVLDPAAGSGAFLLGALRLLAGPEKSGGQAGYALRLRATLGRSIFGVDKNAAAVRLAELRLWLEVIAAEPAGSPGREPTPLPNLDSLVRQGDSLVDPVRGIPLGPPRPEVAARLARVRAELVSSVGASKRRLVTRLRAVEVEAAASAFEGGLRSLERNLAELFALARSPTLFGDARGLTRSERVRIHHLRTARARVRDRLRALRRSGEVPWFHYPVQFADVFARGGFDLVVGNPPWVRAEGLDPAERRELTERFRLFRAASGGRGYAHLPDLAVAFVERALELVAENGVVAFVVPAKLATAGYASRLRAELSSRTTLLVAADLRADPRSDFDATVYPMALLARRQEPEPEHRVRLALAPGARMLPQRDLGASPWALVPDAVRAGLARVQAAFPRLGERFPCHLGVKTGLNRAFLDPPSSVEPEVVRWAVRGRDVAPFRVRTVTRMLWPCGSDGQPLSTLPRGAARHLEQFAEELGRRSDHPDRTQPWWTIFRTRPAAAKYRVIWPDVARCLAAAPLVGAIGRDSIPLNSCYVVVARDTPQAFRLAAWLNSTWCRAIAAATADPASGGFRRFNARVVTSLPFPPALLSDPELLELAVRGIRGVPVQQELDARTASLLGLTQEERRALAGLAPAGPVPGRRIAGAG